MHTNFSPAPFSANHSPDSLFSAFRPLLPLMLVVFVGFVAIGIALPVLPRHVHDTLGWGTVMVGVVMGSQYASSFFARLMVGEVSDARGAHVSVVAGLLVACCTGAVYFLSAQVLDRPSLALGLVIAGRLLTGVAEAFALIGAMSWGVGRLGPTHAGKVLGWMGVALFGAFAAGAPLGVALHAHAGFAGVAVALMLVPLAPLAVSFFIQRVPVITLPRPSVFRVIGAVKLPGLGLMLCTGGYAMTTTFAVLLFAQKGWGSGALAITSMGLGFVAARLLFGHLPDKIGGARVAIASVLVEAVGELLIWGAPNAVLACVGAALAGGGYGLGFQGFGVEAVRRTSPQSRGAAMGAYVGFQDIAMGLAAPLGGLLAAMAGLDSVYLAAGLAALASAGVALLLLRSRPAKTIVA
jgi:MFS family permease